MASGNIDMPIRKTVKIESSDITNASSGYVIYDRVGNIITMSIAVTKANSSALTWNYPDDMIPLRSGMYHRWMADAYNFYMYFYKASRPVVINNNAPAGYEIVYYFTYLAE